MQKSVDWYLSKGFSQKMAEYFVLGRRTIINVKANSDFSLLLTFDNTYTNIHYLDICFKKDAIKNILSFTERFELGFIMYINEIDKNKGYGYDFQVSNVIDLREGNSL